MKPISEKIWMFSVLLLCSIIAFSTCNREHAVEEAKLTYAPEVPPPIARKSTAKVIINLETQEVVGRIADGVEYTFWTFGGTVPGTFIRIRDGDDVEFNLHNHPSSKMPHNIDLHAVTGQGGGAGASLTVPGRSSKFSFKATNAGLFIYHCATSPVGMHIANGKYGAPGLQGFSIEKALTETPDYVVFNGSVGALTDTKALKAKVGETVRIFMGNGGPNLLSSFHVIGEIFDNVYTEGGTIANQKNVQTTLVPAGGSTIVDFKVEVPSTLILVDHSIFRTFNKGSLGMLKVEGEENKTIYSDKQEDRPNQFQ